MNDYNIIYGENGFNQKRIFHNINLLFIYIWYYKSLLKYFIILFYSNEH